MINVSIVPALTNQHNRQVTENEFLFPILSSNGTILLAKRLAVNNKLILFKVKEIGHNENNRFDTLK